MISVVAQDAASRTRSVGSPSKTNRTRISRLAGVTSRDTLRKSGVMWVSRARCALSRAVTCSGMSIGTRLLRFRRRPAGLDPPVAQLLPTPFRKPGREPQRDPLAGRDAPDEPGRHSVLLAHLADRGEERPGDL